MNPADLRLTDSLSNFEGPDGLSGKGLPGSATLAGKNTKIPVSAPRIDTEPIYTALKAAVGEHWTEYKAALSAFILGKLTQTELTTVLLPILSTTPSLTASGPPGPSTAHLHNTLLTSLYANALYRDTPPEPTATWVLATDAPSSSSKPHASGASDAIDDRNKREVMALSTRDRRRIKAVKDTSTSTPDSGLATSKRYHTALDALPSAATHPSLGTTGPPTSAAAAKTNTALEIRRRFGLPLAAETHELPARDNIAARVEPIAYEEGLGGAAGAPAVAELVEIALETYVKTLVGGWVGRTRESGDGLVQPARYKRRLRGEERLADAGAVGVQRDALGRLPVELEAMQHRAAIDADDLRLAVRLDGGMRFAPFFGARWAEEQMEVLETNGVNGHGGEEMELDDDEEEDDGYGWAGAARSDRAQLLDVLGELAVS